MEMITLYLIENMERNNIINDERYLVSLINFLIFFYMVFIIYLLRYIKYKDIEEKVLY